MYLLEKLTATNWLMLALISFLTQAFVLPDRPLFIAATISMMAICAAGAFLAVNKTDYAEEIKAARSHRSSANEQ